MEIVLRQIKRCSVILAIALCSNWAAAQDSTVPPPPDTAAKIPVVPKTVPHKKRPAVKKDSVVLRNLAIQSIRDSVRYTNNPDWLADSYLYSKHPYFQFTNPIHYGVTVKKWEGKETIFYSILALLLFFALIRNGFYRYIMDLFRIFFRTTVRQRQIKDQLVQSPLPSLLLNIFFLLSAGMFLALIFQYFDLGRQFNFWILFMYCMLGLTFIYGVKFISLKLFGWVFQISDAIEAYIFIVFTTNKIIGIALLPFIVVLSFSYGMINQAALTLSIILVAGLFAYRYFLSYVSIHRQIKISFFHFVLYFCAFEIAPLLLINKLLFKFLAETP